jgi:uncharacterized protein (TIGR02118 family)
MLKFIVVIYKRPDLTQEDFRRYLQEIHAPLAKNLPGLRKYVQNFVSADPARNPPGWDAVVELYFDNRAAMEAAWASPQGAVSDADLPAFADLSRTTWSTVDEVTVLSQEMS